MKNQNSSIEEKSQFATHHNAEIIKLLETGSRKIVKDLNNSRQAQFSDKIKRARKLLGAALKSTQNAQELKRIQILAVAIQNVVKQLYLTKKDFHSKKLYKIRKYATGLLKEVSKAIKKRKSGGMPMGK